MFGKKTQLEWLYKVKFAAQSLGYWLRGYEMGVQQVHCSVARQLRRGLKQDRSVTSLRHQGGEEFSERGKIFNYSMSNSF